MQSNETGVHNKNTRENISSEQFLKNKIKEIKERSLSQISPLIIIKPAIFSLFVLLISIGLDLSKVPFLGEVTIGIAKQLYPTWEPAKSTIEPLQFWWLPIISYLFFVGIAVKEYYGLFSHVRSTTPRQNVDRIISSSISLIDGYATALPLVGAAILLVSIKLGPEIFLGISVPFEIKALIVLALAKLFEPVLDYIGVKFQKVLNNAEDFQEQFYQKMQVKQTERLIKVIEQNQKPGIENNNLQLDSVVKFREELEKIKTISFETYQNFTALNKLTANIKDNLKGNEDHLDILNQLSKNIDSMATNLNNEGVASSLNSLELIVNKR